MNRPNTACLIAAILGMVTVSLRADLNIPTPPQPKLRPQTIDDQVNIGYGLAIADVDGDGKDDVLLADKEEIVWYQNPTWKKYRLTGHLGVRDHVCIAARDIDNDGMAEIAVGGEWNPGDTRNSGAVFYLIPPADRTQEWEAVKLPHEPTVHRMHWVKDRDDHFFLAVLPLHGRGNKDGRGDGVRFLGYVRPPEPRGVWDTFELNDRLHKAHNFDLVAWGEPNGSEELLVASDEGTSVMERRGDEWKTSQVTTNAAGEVRSGMLYSGRRFIASIEPMHGNQVVVNTHKLTLTGQLSWTENRVVLDDTLVEGHALATGDLLGIGWDQVVAGWRGGDSVGIRMYVPTHKRGHTWTMHAVLDDNQMACEDLKLADLNQDGKLDMIACGRATKNLIIYWNETPHK